MALGNPPLCVFQTAQLAPSLPETYILQGTRGSTAPSCLVLPLMPTALCSVREPGPEPCPEAWIGNLRQVQTTEASDEPAALGAAPSEAQS